MLTHTDTHTHTTLAGSVFCERRWRLKTRSIVSAARSKLFQTRSGHLWDTPPPHTHSTHILHRPPPDQTSPQPPPPQHARLSTDRQKKKSLVSLRKREICCVARRRRQPEDGLTMKKRTKKKWGYPPLHPPNPPRSPFTPAHYHASVLKRSSSHLRAPFFCVLPQTKCN